MTPTSEIPNRCELRRKPLILVADDDPVSRMLIAGRLLDSVGDVIEVQDGAEAICLLQQHMVDLVITDLEMPRMSGWALMDWLSDHPQHRNTPIIVLSGSEDARPNALSSGASDFILKPIEWKTFKRITQQFLRH